MTERPILFSAPMVRAILDGSKTQTRRVVKLPHNNPLGVWEPFWFGGVGGGRDRKGQEIPGRWTLGHSRTGEIIGCPIAEPSDQLWVRETWMPDAPQDGTWADTAFYGCGMSPLSDIPERFRMSENCLHRATWSGHDLVGWKPSIHMPRWASRITLEVTDVRVERLQDISEADAVAEGIERMPCEVPNTRLWRNYTPGNGWTPSVAIPQNSFRSLWESINGPGSWDLNPWVWAISFQKVTP